MADPKMLYAVVAVVFAGLAVWLAFVFRSAKEPWARVPASAAVTAKVAPVAGAAATTAASEEEEDEEGDDDEDEEDDDPEGSKVTVKDEAATEEAIEKAKAEKA